MKKREIASVTVRVYPSDQRKLKALAAKAGTGVPIADIIRELLSK